MRLLLNRCVLLSCALASLGAAAAQDDLLKTPCVGAPAMVRPGDPLRLVLNMPHAGDSITVKITLSGADGTSVPLEVEIDGPWEGGARCTAHVPQDVLPGTYSLEIAKPDTATYPNTVRVYRDPGAYYVFAHISAPAVADSGDAFQAALAAAGKTEAAFVVVTGPLTSKGAAEELEAVYDAVKTAALPVFVAGDATDDGAGAYARYFPRAPTAWRFGDDGHIVIPTTDRPASGVAWPEGGGRFDGLISYWREALKPARWVVGALPGYQPGAWFRTEQTLLVDDPVAAIITTRANAPELPAIVPSIWGKSMIVGTPPMSREPFRLIDATAQGLRPRELQGDAGNAPDTAQHPGIP